jgi:hypothetical protein
MNRTVKIILGIVVLLLVAGASFFGGTVYGKSQAQTASAARRQGGFTGANGQGQPGANGAGARGGMLFGEITNVGNDGLTVKDNNGKETQVKVTDTTLIQKQATVKVTDLTTGETVIISGSTAADGSITARSVQVAPAGRFGPGGPENAPPPGATPAQ